MSFNLENFKKAMKNKNYSNQNLVDKLTEYGIDVTVDTIKSYRRSGGKNRQPTNDKLVAISKILNVSTDNLLGNDEIEVKYIPLIGVASCGVPNIAYDDSTEYIPVSSELARDGVYAVTADGDSMLPDIKHGSTIICDKNMQCENGNIVHYTTIDGESGLKKYLIDDKGVVTLMPLNSNFTPIMCDEKDLRCARAFKIVSDL